MDQFGKPMPPKDNKPILNEIAVVSIRDKYSSYPSQGLTPERLARIFKEADAGDVYRQSELFEEMEEKDDHLFSQLQTRKNAVLGLEWETLPFSEDQKDQEIAKFVADAFRGMDDLEDAFLDLLDAIGKGFAANEIMWKVDDGKAVIEELRWRHQKRFTFGEKWELRLLTDESPAFGIELPPNKFAVHKYKAKSGHPSRAGVLRVVAWMYLFKNYDIKDWVTFAEIYGMPLRLGKYDASTSEADKEALTLAVQMLGTDAAGIISKATEIQFIEAVAKNSSADVYRVLAEFCNAEMSKAILGQTLTSEVGDRGSYAASKTHGEVRQDLLEADCKALARSIRRDLIKPLVMFNFGNTRRLPSIKFHYEQPEDLETTAKTYSVLVGEMGLPVAAEHVYQRFGIPKPQANQEILVPPKVGVPLPMKAFPAKFRILKDDGAPQGNPPNIIEAQRGMDALADSALEQAMPLLRLEVLEMLDKIFEQATSLEDLRARLTEVYADLNTQDFEDLLARALYMADLYGRWAASG